ncbi:fibronectin type III domain-containing protein [Streptomyces sp. NPDC015346]|uniref:fibronectin type III domain-containing protein n=1 Tax=Streptomyces sp. NPDC015346 TaxID=3364954 RepID=UPI0037010274
MTRNRLSALATTAALAAADGLLTATPASAAVTCASPVWKAEYFANAGFSGTPKLTTCDSAIAENYGYGDPAGVTLPNDNFSVRWSVTRDFGSGGPFSLVAEAQDGIRVNVDGVRKIDLWKNVSTTQKKTVNLTIPSGRHTITVYYAAWTGAANVKFGYAPLTSATADKVRPLAPTGATVAYDRALNKATLKWAANREMDLAGYRVYRRLPTTAWAKVSSATTLVTGTSAVNYPPPTGETYLYELRAVDKAGNESWGSADLTVASVDRTAPSAPAGLTATDGQAGVALAWQPVAGAATYTVHRRLTADTTGPVTQVATGVTATALTDATVAENTGYSYWVSAADAAGNVSARTATVATHGDFAPGAPTGLTALDDARKGIVLNWTAPAAADVVSYRVYRDGALWTTVTEPTYTNHSVRYGTTYRYTVTAVDGAGNESAASAAVEITTEGDLVAPAAVTGLKGTARADGVLLEWDANTEPDLERYDLFKGEFWPDEEEPGGGVWVFHHVDYIAGDATSYLFGSTQDGDRYRFAVVAVDKWGNTLATDINDVSWVEVEELPAAG